MELKDWVRRQRAAASAIEPAAPASPLTLYGPVGRDSVKTTHRLHLRLAGKPSVAEGGIVMNRAPAQPIGRYPDAIKGVGR